MPSVILTGGLYVRIMNSGRIFVGTVLILLGLIVFLNNIGVLPWDLWIRLILLWPVLLIAFGLRIAFPKGPLALLSGLVLVLAVVFAIAYPEYFDIVQTERVSGTSSQVLERGVGEASFSVRVGASNIEVDCSDAYSSEAAGKLYLAEYSVFADRQPVLNYSVSNNKAYVRFEPTKKSVNLRFGWPFSRNVGIGENMKIWLNPKVVWELDLDMGASKLNADLSGLSVSRLDINSGASDIDIELGNRFKHSVVSVTAGASSVRISIPRDAGVKVILDSSLTSTNLKELDFVERDGVYLSPGYSYAVNTVDIEFSSGVSRFVLEWDR